MMWKIVVFLSVALYVQGEEDAISEQRVVIHHQKSFRSGYVAPNKSGNQDEYAQAYPSYEFSYNVNDPKTHDIKGQHETREGDEVKGNYWLIEPSGRKRTVNYQANDDSGFNAEIAYTASLISNGEEKDKDVSVSQVKSSEKENIEENNEEGNEVIVGQEILDNKESNEANEGNNNNPAPVEENLSEPNELVTQNDEEKDINNVDPNVDVNIEQSIPAVENDSNQGNNNNTEKRKRQTSKRNKKHNQARYNNDSNKSSRERSRNSKRVKIDDIVQSETNKRNSHKGRKPNHDRNVQSPKNVFIGDPINVNKEQIDANQEATKRKLNGKVENNNNNEKDSTNNKYTFTTFAPNDEIRRKHDMSNHEETFEHRVRIYHPKNISPVSLKAKHKH